MMTNEDIANAVSVVKKKIDKLNVKKTLLNNEISELYKQLSYSCSNCSTVNEIGNTTFFEEYWYESPHGCSGGDTWHLSDDSASIECPTCGTRLRLFKREHQEFLTKKAHFMAVKQEYQK